MSSSERTPPGLPHFGKLDQEDHCPQNNRKSHPKDQIFSDAHVEVKIIEKFLLSSSYTPEYFYKVYRNSMLRELKRSEPAAASSLSPCGAGLFRGRLIIHVSVPDSVIRKEKEQLSSKTIWRRSFMREPDSGTWRWRSVSLSPAPGFSERKKTRSKSACAASWRSMLQSPQKKCRKKRSCQKKEAVQPAECLPHA